MDPLNNTLPADSTQYSINDDIGNVNFRITIPVHKYTTLICHYIPPQFPVPAYLDRKILDSCRRDWIKLCANKDQLDTFLSQFYVRLIKRSPRFDDVFPTGAEGDVFKKNLLVKAIEKCVGLKMETCVQVLCKLGEFHQGLNIRPWMFSEYFLCMIECLSETLGSEATYVVMERWYQLFGFVALHLIEGAIVDNVLNGEVGVGSFVGEFQGDSRLEIKAVRANKAWGVNSGKE